ncbi:MAG: recombinase family protein [Chloroflexi bacterium]|nr:MAG: recombinase family protein [Chloroflexota bacterium]
MTSAAIYARVSTARQEQEASIDSQIAALMQYVDQVGYRVADEHHFIDQGVSGARLDRPALDRLRDLAPEGAFEVVLCLSPDRLARRYVYQRLVLDELAAVGVRVIFLSQPEVPDDPHQELLLGIQGLFAEYERAVISERMRRGKLHRLKTGQLMPPQAPYGYQYRPVSEPDGGRWVVVLRQAEVVRDIFRWYTSGCTVSQIAARLNQETIPAPKGPRWYPEAVRRILCQSAYQGTAYYNRHETVWEAIGQPRRHGHGRLQFPRYRLRPPEEWIACPVPAIVSPEQWQQAQEQLQMNQRFAARNNRQNRYLLRGLLVCGICSHTLVGRTYNGQRRYYCRYGGKHRPPDVPPHSCVVVEAEIAPPVWQALTELLRQPARLVAAWRAQVGVQNDTPDETPQLKRRQRTLNQQWERLLDAFQDGLLDKAELAERKARIDQEQQRLQARLEAAARREHADQYEQRLALTCDAFAERVAAALASPSFETQQEVIRLLIDHIVVEDDAITIKHIVPAEDDPRLCRLEHEFSET